MNGDSHYSGPLKGLNVIDFGHYFAGPMAAMLLADQGANVIHVVKPLERQTSDVRRLTRETLQGRELPEQQFRLLNRNKKLLALDLKTEEGKAEALALIEQADVLIENFRPGVMARLGLDYNSVKQSNPRLIYLSLPGFASTDKERAHIQAWEGIVGAAVGLYTEISFYREMLNFPPLYTWVPLCSMYAGVNGAMAIMAALLAREESGVGTVIEAPLAEVAVMHLTFFFTSERKTGRLRAHTLKNGQHAAEKMPETPLPEHLQPLALLPQDDQAAFEEKLEQGRWAAIFSHPMARPYRCKDGRQIYMGGFNTQTFVGRILKVLGIDKEVYSKGFVNLGPWVVDLDNNVCAELSPERKSWLTQRVSDVILTKTADEWENLLSKGGVKVAKIRTREEWLALEPLKKTGVFAELDNGQSTLVTPGRLGDVTGPNDSLMASPQEYQQIDSTEARKLFERDETSVLEKTSANARNKLPLKKGDLLKGLKVLDMANVAAGPLAGMYLAEYGAEVIKADPPYYLFPGCERMGAGLGKKSILTDLTTAPGKEIFSKLVAWADVVQHNILDDTGKRLGATQEKLQAINPNVISSQFSAFGGTYRGGWENRIGFDFTLHATSGLMAQFGSLEQPQPHGMMSCGDMMGGCCLALNTLISVYQRRTIGHAGEARTSLARAINCIQFPYMIAENGVSDWGEASGQFAKGNPGEWWQRIYACNDGWIFVGAHKDKAADLAKFVMGPAVMDTVVIGAGDGNEQGMENALAKNSCDHWQSELNNNGFACHKIFTMEDIFSRTTIKTVSNEAGDETAAGSTEVLLYPDHPSGEAHTVLAAATVRVGEDHSYRRLRAPQAVGGNTREILQDLGYSDETIDEFIRLKISHEYLPELGSKAIYYFGQQ